MGPAAEILHGFDDSSDKALDDLLGRLRHRFGTVDECQQAMRDFESRRQSDSESLAEFEQVLRTLRREAWPDQTDEQRDPVLKRRFEEGVASAELRQYLRLHRRDLDFRQTTEKARIFAATMGATKARKSVRFMSETPAPAIHHIAVPTIDFTPVLCRFDDIEKKVAGNGPRNLTRQRQPISQLHHVKARRQTEDRCPAVDVRVGQVVAVNQSEAEEHFRIVRSRLHPPRLHLHQGWPHRTTAYQHVDRPTFVVAVVDVVVCAGYVSEKDVTAVIILHWRIANHLRLRLRMTVRHCVVQHRRGQDATYVEPTVVTLTSIVEMPVTSTSLHRSSQVKYSYRSRSWKTSFGVRVRANGLLLFLRARALIRSSVGLRPTDTYRPVQVNTDLEAD